MSWLLALALWPIKTFARWFVAASWGTRLRVVLALIVFSVWQVSPWAGGALTVALWLGPRWWARRRLTPPGFRPVATTPPMETWETEGAHLSSPAWASSTALPPASTLSRSAAPAAVQESPPRAAPLVPSPAVPPRRKSRFA